mgnify:FL=1
MNERIAIIRKKEGMTQEAFAKEMGISKNYMNLIENNKKNPGDRLISDICRRFNVNEEWLRTGEGEMFNPVPNDDDVSALVLELLEDEDDVFHAMVIKMMRKYRALDSTSKRVIKNFIEEIMEKGSD